jgi:hypothetical protein
VKILKRHHFKTEGIAFDHDERHVDLNLQLVIRLRIDVHLQLHGEGGYANGKTLLYGLSHGARFSLSAAWPVQLFC